MIMKTCFYLTPRHSNYNHHKLLEYVVAELYGDQSLNILTESSTLHTQFIDCLLEHLYFITADKTYNNSDTYYTSQVNSSYMVKW